jgi:hypothetical protein
LLQIGTFVKGDWTNHSPNDYCTQNSCYAVLVRENRLPTDAAPLIAKRLHSQILALRGIWDNTLAYLMANPTHEPVLQTFDMKVTLGKTVFRDCFEWDIYNLSNSPELFAQILAQDLALPREHEVLLAHAIRCRLFEFWGTQGISSAPPKKVEATRSVVRVKSEEWGPRLETFGEEGSISRSI